MAIAENLQSVHGRIADAAKRSGRAADDITLVAVSKTWPAEVVRDAVDAGQMVFGENKVQEGIEKVPVLPPNLDWHLIGHLQKNKVRKAITLFSWIETVDSLKLARRIDHIAAEEGVVPKLLLQVNVGKDEAKSGYSSEGVRRDLELLFALEQVEIHGLMTIPPFDPDPERTRPHFAALRKLRDELERECGVALPALSMGMSHDFEVAIEEGATFVRVGTTIFGKRQTAIDPV